MVLVWPSYEDRNELMRLSGRQYRVKGQHYDACDDCTGVWDEGGWCPTMMKMDYQQLVLYEMAVHPDDVRHPIEHMPPFGTAGRR